MVHPGSEGTAASSTPVAVDDDAGSSLDRWHARILWAIIAFVVLALWIRPITSSLWIDELGTWWAVKDGAREAIDRALEVHGQSPLYYLFAWAIRRVAGEREWALRLPSMALTAGTAFMLYRAARRALDVEYARLVVLVFVAWPAVAFAAIDYRPYALALFLATAATLAFAMWLERGGALLGTGVVALAALTIYTHYLYGAVLAVWIVYAVYRRTRGPLGVRWPSIAAAAIGLAILTAPLAAQVLQLWERRSEWTSGAAVSIDWLISAATPAAMISTAVVGGIAVLWMGGRLVAPPVDRSFVALSAAWFIVPIGGLCLISAVSAASVLHLRYAAVAAPAGALLAGLAGRAVRPADARRVLALVFAVSSILVLGGRHHSVDWRGSLAAAASQVDEGSLTVVQSGFTESDVEAWRRDPELRTFLLAPISRYPITGPVAVLPKDLTLDATEAIVPEIEADIEAADRVIFVGGEGTDSWLARVLGPGWEARRIPTADEPVVTVFDRTTETDAP